MGSEVVVVEEVVSIKVKDGVSKKVNDLHVESTFCIQNCARWAACGAYDTCFGSV